MNNLLNWEYYNSHFPKLSEEEFNAIVYKAERTVLKRICKKYDDFTEEERIDVMDCICDIINNVNVNRKEIASISNDGYSESYVNFTEEENSAMIESIIRSWLGDTHLLKREFIGY